MSIEAMKQALEAFEDIASWYDHDRSVGSLASSMYEAKCLATVQATALRTAIEQARSAPVQEPEYCDPSSTVYKLAEMVMSDCGHSTNNQRLLDRIADRIQRHIDAAEKQEPVAWQWKMSNATDHWQVSDKPHPDALHKRPLYTTPPAAPVQEPVFWYRPCSNGMYEGPIHNAQIEEVRKQSGAWVPLVTATNQSEAQRQWVGLTEAQREALVDARNEAMHWAMKGRIPECAAFCGIAQNLDWLCDQFAIEAKLREKNGGGV